MKCRLLALFLLFATLSAGVAGVEGVYRSTNSDTTLRINADGTASHRSLTSITRYKDFDHAREDKQPRQGVRTSVSRGRWTTNENKLFFEGDALVTLEIKGEPARTERMPLKISCAIETNGDLIVVPGESSARLVKQVVAVANKPANDPKKPVKVGFNLALSGSDAALDASAIQAAQLFFDDLNATGGIRIGGRPTKLEIIVRDNGSDGAKAMEVMKKLVEEDGVIAVIGPNASGLAIPAAEAAESLRCTLLCPWSTMPILTRGRNGEVPRRYVFRICFTDSQEMEALASFASVSLEAKTAAVLGGGAHGFLFPKFFEQHGGEVAASERIPPSEDDAPAFSRIRSKSPDVLFTQNLSKERLEKLRRWGITARLLGGDDWNRAKDLIREMGDHMHGAHFATHYAADSIDPLATSFRRAFKKRYGVDADDIAALTYDACAVLAEAIKRADVFDRDKVRDELGGIWNFRGVTGSFSYKAPPYDPIKSVFIVRVDKGETRLAKEVRP